MNQKLRVLTAAAAAAAILAGCMPVQNNSTQNSAAGGSSSQNQSAVNPFRRDPSSGQDTEQKSVDLQVTVGDQTKTVTALVYTGSSGYSIAVPETWERDDSEPEWSPADNDDVALTVRYYSGKKAEEVLDAFQREEKGYTFETPTKGALAHVDQVTELCASETETDEDDGETGETIRLVTYFIDTDKGCFALLLECPETASEQYGGYLGAMANSFELTEKNSTNTNTK